MKYATLNDHTFALRLELGDDIHATLQAFCSHRNITNAAIQGIGSIQQATLAHYSIQTKQFTNKPFEGVFEVTSLLGNVAQVDNQPFAHIHLTISDSAMQTFGGHLVKGECSATLELIISSYPSAHSKSLDEAIGLKVWDFSE
jgi:uncharacterized protein